MNKGFVVLTVLLFVIAVLSCQREWDNKWDHKGEMPPSEWAPSNLQFGMISFDKLEITWTQHDEDVSGFRVDISEDGENFENIALLPGESRSWIQEVDALESATYTYRIYAMAAHLLSDYYEAKNYLKRPKPQFSNIYSLSPNIFRFFWTFDSPDGIEGFKIYRALADSDQIDTTVVKPKLIATVPAVDTAYTDSVFNMKTTDRFYVHYIIRAFKGNVLSEGCNFKKESGLSTPDKCFIRRMDDQRVEITWENPSTYNHDIVLQRKVEALSYENVANLKMDDGSFIDDSFDSDKSIVYRFIVKAEQLNSHGNEFGFYSGMAGPVLNISPSGTDEAVLDWDFPDKDIDGFKIDRKVNDDSWQEEYAVLEDPGQSFYIDKGLDYSANIYSYRLYAYSLHYQSAKAQKDLVLSSLITREITEIGANYAKSGGEIMESHEEIDQRGICWDTLSQPELNDYFTDDGSGDGVYVSEMTGLKVQQVYYVRAYIIKGSDTVYGNERSFKTLIGNKPSAAASDATNITATTAVLHGNVVSSGDTPVTERGFCWKKGDYPSIEDDNILVGSGTGEFSAEINGLEQDAVYNFRSWARNAAGIDYSSNYSFSTPVGQVPEVSTGEVKDIGISSALCEGMVITDGGVQVTHRGVCWNQTGAPAFHENHTFEGEGLGEFESQLNDLLPDTKYYVRAYAINAVDIDYGEEKVFFTLQAGKPTVNTLMPFNISSSRACCGGSITDNGGFEIMSCGVCWSTEHNPDINDDHTSEGKESDSFESLMNGLEPNTTYYVRAYAANPSAVGYGSEFVFKTEIACPAVMTDNEGNDYETVLIGDQCWMKENLNMGRFKASHWVFSNDGEVERYCYDNNIDNCETYGALYSWDEMMNYSSDEGAQGICPQGWHIPSESEWEELLAYVGGTTAATTNLRDTYYWSDGGGNNQSGFSARGAGILSESNSFYGLRYQTNFWSSSMYLDKTCAYEIRDFGAVLRVKTVKQLGYSVRCIRH